MDKHTAKAGYPLYSGNSRPFIASGSTTSYANEEEILKLYPEHKK